MAYRVESIAQSVEALFEIISAEPRRLRCPRCGFKLAHVETTFFLQNGKAWIIPLPLCQRCDPHHGAVTVDTHMA
jgi:hypothetical protein